MVLYIFLIVAGVAAMALGHYEKRGKQLAELGATLENLEEFLYGEVIEK